MELSNVNVYRMTHIANIPHILKNGITHRSSPQANPNYREIGDSSLIQTRKEKQVFVNNGEVSGRFESIILGDFIPFYFGVRMPMLYVIQQGGNFVNEAIPAEDIVYVVCSIEAILQKEVDFYFSDGHATDSLTSIYNREKVDLVTNIIDWAAIKAPYWSGQENLNLKRKKQAELLIKGDIPADCVLGFGCFNENSKQRLTAMGINNDNIKVIPKAYY